MKGNAMKKALKEALAAVLLVAWVGLVGVAVFMPIATWEPAAEVA